MKPKRRAFVVSLGKPESKLERGFYERYKRNERSQLVPTIKQLKTLSGVYSRPKGIVIDSFGLRQQVSEDARFLGALQLISGLATHPLRIVRENAERIAIIRQLSDLGCRVAVPKYGWTQSKKLLSKIRGKAKVFEAKPPISGKMKIDGKETKEVNPSALWVRDLWKKVGEKRIKRFSQKGENNFGEGGRTVDLPNKVIIANINLKENPTVKELQKRGYKFFFVNAGEAFHQHMSELLKTKVYVLHDHADLFVGTAGNVMLVDYDFFRQNRGTIKEAAREAGGLKILFVPKKEADLHPANFLPIEPNIILIDKAAKETIKILRENGVKVIPTAVSLKATRATGGGIRCLVNEL